MHNHRGCYMQDLDEVLCPVCLKRFEDADAEYHEHVDNCVQDKEARMN
jgi:hypothetical protein